MACEVTKTFDEKIDDIVTQLGVTKEVATQLAQRSIVKKAQKARLQNINVTSMSKPSTPIKETTAPEVKTTVEPTVSINENEDSPVFKMTDKIARKGTLPKEISDNFDQLTPENQEEARNIFTKYEGQKTFNGLNNWLKKKIKQQNSGSTTVETQGSSSQKLNLKLDPKNTTLLVPINNIEIDEKAIPEGFVPKKEHHLTVLGFPQGKQLKKILAEKPELEPEVQKLIDEADFSIDTYGDTYNISRDREQFKDWKDKSKGKETIHEEAIIQKVEAPGVEDFITKLNGLLGTDFPVPYSHISVATNDGGFGIGIVNEAGFASLNPKKIDAKIITEKQGSSGNQSSLFNDTDIEVSTGELDLKENGSLKQLFYKYEGQDIDEGLRQETVGDSNFYKAQDMMLDSFEKAFSDGAKSKITLSEFETAVSDSRETAGSIEHKSDRTAGVNLRWNKYHGTARKSEVFMHEILHFMTNRAFKTKPHLQITLKSLRDLAVKEGVTYELFLTDIYNNNMNPTQSEIDIAKDKFDYVFSKYSDPEEFFAYAMTNEHVFNAIADLKAEPKLFKELEIEKDENGRNKRGLTVAFKQVFNAILKAVNAAWSAAAGAGGKNGAQLVTDTMTELVSLQALLDDEETKIATGDPDSDNFINRLNSKISPWTKRFDEKVEEFTDSVNRGDKTSKIAKKLENTMLIGRLMQSRLIQDIVTSITQKTDNNKWSHLYELYRQGKNFTEKHRKGLSDAVEKYVGKYFERIDSSTRKAVSTIIFNLDIPSMIDSNNGIDLEQLKVALLNQENADAIYDNYYANLKELYAKKNDTVEGRFGTNTDAEFESDIKHAMALGQGLIDGGVHIGNQQMNADNIYNKYYLSGSGDYDNKVNEERTMSVEDFKIINMMNQFITAYGIKHSAQVDKTLVYEYLGEEKNRKDIKSMMNMYKTFVNDAVDDLYINNFNPVAKGFFEQQNEAKMSYDVVPESELDYYIGKFGNMVEIEAYGMINGIKYYEVAGKDHSVGFDEGMFSISGNTIPGLSLKGILTQQLTSENQKKRKRDRTSIDSLNTLIEDKMIQFAENGGVDKNLVDGLDDQQFLPVYDAIGNIIDYHVNPTRQKKIKYLKSNTDVVKSAAFTFSKMKHRQASIIHNKEVVDTLLEYHENNLDDDFVVLEKHTPSSGKFDEDIHGRWNRIPEYTRNYIFTKTGSNKIAVPKKMLTTITGEKGVTLSNFNLGPIDLRGKKKTQKMILAFEDYIREVWSWVKESIAIRMGGVVAANTLSNMMQAWVYGGIDPITYTKMAKRKWSELDQYTDMQRELEELQVALVGQGDKPSKSTQNKIRILSTRLEKNPFHALVQDGQFSPIIEDVNVEEDATGHIAQMIEEGFNKNKFTKMVKPIKEFVFMDRNTLAYQGMLKFTQAGDVITRSIMLEMAEEKAIAQGKPWSAEEKQDYLNFLDQLFVNYSYIDNRFMRYAERMYGIMFTKYLFRQAKAMHSVATQAPARLGAFLTTEQLTGIDLTTADDDYWRFTEALGRRFDIKNPTDMFIGDDIPILNLFPKLSDLYKSTN